MQLNLPLLAPLALFLLGTLCYATFFLLLAMAVSARARSSASALVTLMVIWAALVVVIPQAAYLAGARAVAAPDWNQVWDYWGEVRDNLSLEGLTPRGREEGAADDYAVEREVARRYNEAEKEQRQLYEEARLREVRQFEVTRGLSLISPGYAFQGTAEALLGTGLVRYKAFVKAAPGVPAGPARLRPGSRRRRPGLAPHPVPARLRLPATPRPPRHPPLRRRAGLPRPRRGRQLPAHLHPAGGDRRRLPPLSCGPSGALPVVDRE